MNCLTDIAINYDYVLGNFGSLISASSCSRDALYFAYRFDSNASAIVFTISNFNVYPFSSSVLDKYLDVIIVTISQTDAAMNYEFL